ncbi:diguanylate cyclase [Halorhodospira halochloris]|uniref:diguanylate cyclase n=1 Tax=Halorhodospira halochloris TaxID=1052 RepID=A0A0X8X7E7_HALHR|nr:diguanylate cyclase [Halorhodospira halochloris]MBK1652304.1 hypothetical protein [Halorhodospira halochloris]MCG5529723.1 diguanylate cyclase [Halorhodospira halochloris]MCG5548377.1 diguanylate cyclase [Halorhodospira halochloris]BAU56899.1 transcriptional regulator [Halorhodospira halochloris]
MVEQSCPKSSATSVPPDLVLVVEDSRSIAGLLAERIDDELHLGPLVAYDRAQAKRLLDEKAERMVAAVLDLNLPDAPDGEVVRDVVSRDIPVIVLTATLEDDLRDYLIRVGVADYVVKGAIDSLDTVIQGLARIRRNRGIGALVVDDSRSARLHLVELLRRWGFGCEQAANGEQALERMRKPDSEIRLVICDQNMPGMDGITLIRNLRRQFPAHRLGIIGVSSYGSGLLSARLLKAGANDFITRPFLEEELSVRVNQNVDLLDLLRQAEDFARRDPLTGLGNRRYFAELAATLVETSERTKQPLAALVVDLDHFKQINDDFGHAAGDAALRSVAGMLGESVRRADLLARAGGEEFYILSLGLDLEGAKKFAERIRTSLEQLEVRYAGQRIAISASIGVASFSPPPSVEVLVEAADLAMYAAKKSGRNNVKLATQD